MYKQIKQLADEAIALQNKDRMDAALREISGLAMQGSMLTMFEDARIAKWGSEPCPECLKPRARCAPVEEVAAAPGLIAVMDSAKPGDTVQATGFGMVPLKLEGCASHPNDINAPMTDEQRARQLAAHERDVAAAPAKPAKKGAK